MAGRAEGERQTRGRRRRDRQGGGQQRERAEERGQSGGPERREAVDDKCSTETIKSVQWRTHRGTQRDDQPCLKHNCMPSLWFGILRGGLSSQVRALAERHDRRQPLVAPEGKEPAQRRQTLNPLSPSSPFTLARRPKREGGASRGRHRRWLAEPCVVFRPHDLVARAVRERPRLLRAHPAPVGLRRPRRVAPGDCLLLSVRRGVRRIRRQRRVATLLQSARVICPVII